MRFMSCPKCGAEGRDNPRFCPRCHATLRYQCPSCHHEQSHGGTCDECGVDFLKYLGVVVSAKKAEADAMHERVELRSTLLKGILFAPFTAGLPLIRQFLVGNRKRRGG
jgi:Double zinc ribbon